ncbi:hypothetical protein [Curtobacterium citreum]|uniref:hypothetical protein n=1 Tax=Curtobacterium citreum TaxID=2036 RepID=UPI00217E8EF5|nr:hypothetical protein [Curtobacterium flaccumfaciens]MCS6583324.1 hypothetical protein [Curtobacterium flaccumfaciens pv. beticola]
MDHITATRLARCDAFIAAADAEHGGRYDYSLLPDEFVNVKTRVRIICPEHGIFRMAPQDHKAKTVKGRVIPGQGCHSCSTRCGPAARRLQLFLDRAREVHGSRYDYRNVDFVDQRTSIRIRCFEHGAFSVMPKNHLAGEQCGKCGARARAESLRRVDNSGQFGDPRRIALDKKRAATERRNEKKRLEREAAASLDAV